MSLLCYRPQTGRKEIKRSEFEMKYSPIDSDEAEVDFPVSTHLT